LTDQKSGPRLLSDRPFVLSAVGVEVCQALMINREARKHLGGLLKLDQGFVVAARPNESAPEKRLDPGRKRIERNGVFHLRDGFVVPTERRQIAIRIKQMCEGVAGIEL